MAYYYYSREEIQTTWYGTLSWSDSSVCCYSPMLWLSIMHLHSGHLKLCFNVRHSRFSVPLHRLFLLSTMSSISPLSWTHPSVEGIVFLTLVLANLFVLHVLLQVHLSSNVLSELLVPANCSQSCQCLSLPWYLAHWIIHTGLHSEFPTRLRDPREPTTHFTHLYVSIA